MPIECAGHPFLTVVIATLGQSQYLGECVRSVLDQSCERLEIIVVRSGSCAAPFPELQGLPVRVIGVERRGVSLARNAAIPHARGEIVAFLDDDVTAEPGWAHALLKGFTDPAVHCVTGRVRPEGAGYMPAKRYTSPRITSQWTLSRTQRGWVGRAISVDAGFGCNMAFRRSFLEQVPFPEQLGAGARISTADELYMFFQVIRTGFVLLHTPDSVVTHFFGDVAERSRERVKGIHAGNIAFHLKMMADFPEHRFAFFRELFLRAIRAVRYGANDPGPKAMAGFSAWEKTLILLSGLWLYWTANHAFRKETAHRG
jgi:glycosyltransferase involved in cell wall biosynthesis